MSVTLSIYFFTNSDHGINSHIYGLVGKNIFFLFIWQKGNILASWTHAFFPLWCMGAGRPMPPS